ncbi:MAG: HD domain-containing protein, partial [Pseudomonadota bacterium]
MTTDAELQDRLEFIKKAERLKDTIRSAYTADGQQESVAEHTWRLTLLAITLADYFPQYDLLKLLKICILHDLGEAVGGDIPAPQQGSIKAIDERRDFISLLTTLPAHLQHEFTA